MALILIIDDEPLTASLCQEILEQAGYDVLVAHNGHEGLYLFSRTPADLVITDVFMPVQDGLEVIMNLRREKLNVPIIAITGNAAGHHFLNMANQLGAQHTMAKPFSATDLVQAVQQQLQGAP
ncbi:MAG: response regulator [Nitrospira sp.]